MRNVLSGLRNRYVFVALFVFMNLAYIFVNDFNIVYAEDVKVPSKCLEKTTDNKSYKDNTGTCKTWRYYSSLNRNSCMGWANNVDSYSTDATEALTAIVKKCNDLLGKSSGSSSSNEPSLEECKTIPKLPGCDSIIAADNKKTQDAAKRKQENQAKNKKIRECMISGLDKYIKDKGLNSSNRSTYLSDIKKITPDDGSLVAFGDAHMHIAQLYVDCGGSITADKLDQYNKATTEEVEQEKNESKTSCAIDSVGWIVCPAASFMEDAITGTYEWIAKHFLTIQSGSLFDESKGVFDSWSKFRDIANVLFVILFVVVIVSQITNVGISNYGIKKMLPRLVVFAILINVSYWVSVIFVDLSNIIGRGIFNLLSANGNSSHINLLDAAVGSILSIAGASAVMGGIILALVAALLSIFLMFLILVVRQAAVVVLIVVSPIAFASAILPGTEPFFSKWKGMLKSMLIVYPICSLMMGGMIVASDVLIRTIDDEVVNLTNYALKVFYILIPVVGLSSVYIVIKGALAAIDKLTGGSISGKIGGMVNGLQDKAKNSSFAQRERNMWGAAGAKVGGLPGVRNVRDFSRRSRYKALSGKNKLENAKAEAERDGMIAELQSQASRGKLDPDGQRLLHKLQGDKEKDEANLLNAGASSMAKSFGYNEMGQFTGDVEGDAERALTEAMKSGNSQQIDQAIKAIGAANLSDGQRASVLHRVFSGAGHIDTSTKEGAAIAQAVSKNMDLFGKMKAENFAVNSLAGKLASNQSGSLSKILQDTSTYSNMTAEQLTKQGGDSMENIRKLAANNPQFAAQMQNLAETASKDTELMAQAKGANKEFIDELRAGVQPSNVSNHETSTGSSGNSTTDQGQTTQVDSFSYGNPTIQPVTQPAQLTQQQGQTLHVDNLEYNDSFIVPHGSSQQSTTQQTQPTQQSKPTGQSIPTRKFVSGGISSGNPRHLTVNQQQLGKIRQSPGYNNTKKPQ